MKSDSKLPIRERIERRRKLRRRRNAAAFFLLVLALMTAAVLRYDIIKADEDGTGEKAWDLMGQGSRAADAGGITDPGENGSLNEPGLTSEDTDGSANSSTDDSGTGNGSMDGSDAGSGGKGLHAERKDIQLLKNELEDYISKLSGQYGVYYTHLVNGDEFGINDTGEYIAASTVKVPLNLYLYKKIEEGSVNPEGLLTYLQKDYEGGTGSLQYKEVGTKYKVRELSRLSVEVSDNVATNMLLRLLGRKNLKDYMRSLGGVVVRDDKNVSCPKDMALYMRKVYEFKVSNPELGGELMDFLLNTVFNDRIPGLLPEDVKVAHKIGTQVGAVHDVGIVFAEDPYIIAIMSKNVNEAEGAKEIANISKKVYDFVTG